MAKEKDNIFLFTGKEKYLVNKEVKKWKKAFKKKYSEDNVYDVKDKKIDVSQLKNDIFSTGLFSSRKLIIIHGFPNDTFDENKISKKSAKQLENHLLDDLDKVPEDVVLIFVSYKPDKRRKNYKTIKKKAQVKEFKKLKWKDLQEFVKKQFGEKITKKNVKYFLSKMGEDVLAIQSEIEKIKLYCKQNDCKVSKDIIDKVVYASSEIDAFKLLDKMFFDQEKSLKILQQIEESGQNEFQTLGMIYWWLRTILQIMDVYESWVTNKKKIASELGVHPFVVYKNYKHIDKYLKKKQEFKNLFGELVNLDYSIKTGQSSIDVFRLSLKKIIMEIDTV